jgi:hypothetical protein
MSTDDTELAHVEPSLFVKALSIVGAFIAVSATAALATYVLVSSNGWQRHRYSIFGLAWGTSARLLEFSVRQGIKQNIASRSPASERPRILGEQLTMLRITRRFVHVELVGSVLLLITEIFTP